MEHSVNLSELQYVVGKYVDQYNLLVAGGPLAAAGVIRTFVGKSKVMSIAMGGGIAWLAVQEISGPMKGLIEDQFGYLQQIFGMFK